MSVARILRAVLGFLAASFGVGLLVDALAVEQLAVASGQAVGGLILLRISLGLYRSLAARYSPHC